MAEDRIDFDDLFDKNLSKKIDLLDDSLKAVDKTVNLLTDSVDKLNNEIGKDSVKAIVSQEKAFDMLNTSFETSIKLEKEKIAEQAKVTKLEKERLKLIDRLNEANSDSIQVNEELKVQLSEQRKENKKLAKEKLGLITAYDKESKRLIKLRKDYKNLILEEGKTTKESRKLLKEIKKLDTTLKDVDGQVGQNQRNVGNYTDAIKDQTKSILAWTVGLIGAGKALDGVQESVSGSEEGSEELRKATGALSGAFNVFKNVASSAALDVFQLGKSLVSGKASLETILNPFSRTAKATENFGDKLSKAATGGADIAEATIDLEKKLNGLLRSLALVNQEFEKQNQIAGDSTRSFDKIEAAALAAAEANRDRADIEQQIADEQIAIINRRIELSKDSARSMVALEQELTQALVAQTDARTAAQLAAADVEKTIRENARDRFEKELDFSLDISDTQKSINERQISNDLLTLKVRNKIFEDTTALMDDAFNEQVMLVEDITGQQIDFDELIAESSEKKIRAKIKEVSTDEIILQRILDVIRDRKTALQDLTEAERDLAAARQEQNEMDDGTIKNAEKKAEELKQLTETSLDAVDSLVTESLDKRDEAIDKQLDASEKQQDRLVELANRGVRDANTSLAEEQKKQAELLREQERIEKRKAQLEFVVSGLNLFTQKVENDDSNALGSTIAQMTLLTQFLKNAPLFYEGTDNIGASMSPTFNTGRDDYLARVDKDEAILNPLNSKRMRALGGSDEMLRLAESNIVKHELSELGHQYRAGTLGGNDTSNITHMYASQQQVVQAVERIGVNIVNSMPETSVKIRDIHQLVDYKTKKGNKTEIVTKRLRQ